MEKQILKIEKNSVKLGQNDFYLASGDIHYFRIHPNDWEERILLAKDFGLTAIQTYVPWHLHEKSQGNFDFYGQFGELNLKGFLELVQKHDLKVLLRPAPYICSECDNGGLPAWLMFEKDISVRCCDEDYLAAVSAYYKRICKEFVPYLSTNGGPIIMIAIDNEYGGYGNDKQYLIELRRMLTENGVDVPFYTTDGYSSSMTVNGSLDDCWHGINFRSTPSETEKALDLLKAHRPNFPIFAGEFWCGRGFMWGENNSPRDPAETAAAYKLALEKGAFVNFYMFAGGTNFAFTSGSIHGAPLVRNPDKTYPCFEPYTTSYDVDALIGEDGNPTEKYFLCRDALDKYLGKPKRPHTYNKRPAQSIEIKLEKAAGLFENLNNLSVLNVKSLLPKTMEALNQCFGYVLYSTNIYGKNSWTVLDLKESVSDRATVYVNDIYTGEYTKDGKSDEIKLTVPEEGLNIKLLVENLGRENNSYDLMRHKGMVKPKLTVNTKNSYYWEQWSLPLDNLTKLDYKKLEETEISENMPIFLKGTFNAQADVDTFLLTEGFTHGNVWINGVNIGRYWDIGSQKTLYIPGGLLKPQDNVIEIFDTQYNGKTRQIKCVDKNILH